MIRIGLTGGIAAGKSTVANRLRDLGAFVIDYDSLAREVVSPGSEGLRRIVEVFGESAVDECGSLRRQWLADRVFAQGASDDARQVLDSIQHPLIVDQAHARESQFVSMHPDAVVVHDIPLLAEVKETLPFRFSSIVTVEAPEEARIRRMMSERGMSENQAKQRISHQSTQMERLAIADTVIDSTQPIERMFERVDKLYAQWLRHQGRTS